MAEHMGKTDFAVYENLGETYVMAYLCWCGRLAVAFGSEPYGIFNGACPDDHVASVQAS